MVNAAAAVRIMLSWQSHSLDCETLFFFGTNRMWESLSSVGSVRRQLMASPAQPLSAPGHSWHPLHVFSQRCPENHKSGCSENHMSYTGSDRGPGQCRPFLPQHLSNLAWPQPEIHRHDSYPHGSGPSLGSSGPWGSPHNGSFYSKESPVQSWV